MQIPPLLQHCGIVLTVSLAVQSASAGLIVNLDSTFPINAEVTAATDTQANFTSATVWSTIEQTFKVTTGFQLDKLFIEYTVAKAGQTFELQIFSVPDVNAAVVTGVSLFPSALLTFTIPSNSAADRIMELDLTGTDQIALAASEGTSGYAVRFRDLSVDTTQVFGWQRTNFQAYSDGAAYENGTSNGSGSAGRDLSLAIVSVPEPGTAALSLSGLALIGISRRNRRRKSTRR